MKREEKKERERERERESLRRRKRERGQGERELIWILQESPAASVRPDQIPCILCDCVVVDWIVVFLVGLLANVSHIRVDG